MVRFPAKEAKLPVIMAPESMAWIQECHIIIAHILCEIAEHVLFHADSFFPAAWKGA
jgi:hypothetical protein